jgi:hypothetical protein
MVSQYYRSSATATATASHGHSNGALFIHYHAWRIGTLLFTYIHIQYMYVLYVCMLCNKINTTTYIFYLLQLQVVLSANNKVMIILLSKYMYCIGTQFYKYILMPCACWPLEICTQSGCAECWIACNPIVKQVGLRAIWLCIISDCAQIWVSAIYIHITYGNEYAIRFSALLTHYHSFS